MLDQSALSKIRSGVEIIDGRLGGLIAGKAYLIYGEPGTGKTVFGLQFLNEGLIGGETCGLVTQENPEDLLTMARHIGFQWDDHLASSRLIILRYQPNFVLHFSKSFNLDEIFRELRHLSNNSKTDRLVFDPITPVVDCVNRINYTKVFAELFALVESLRSTTLLTLDEIQAVSSSPFLRTLISLAFGAIHLRISPDLKRKMFFQKMKYQPRLLEPATYTIEPRKGIVTLASAKANLEECEIPKKRILVADNDRKTTEGIKQILGDRYALTVVHDGIEALTKTVNNPLDLIILDVTLPKIDGFDVCRRLRSQGSWVPIFLISGERRRISDKVKGFNLGADEYMLKPVDFVELQSRVQAILQRGRDLKHAVPPSTDGPGQGTPESSPRGSPKKRVCASLSQAAFKERVNREIEEGPSNLFTLVTYRFEERDGQEKKELPRICTPVLASQVREGDFVGNLGNGKVCIFLKGASRESSAGFIKRARKKISRVTRERLGRAHPSIRMKTGSATFPVDGEDTTTLLEKAFENGPRKSQVSVQDP